MTYQRPDSDRYNYPEAYLRARIVGMLGGRAVEEIVYGTKTTGAENDIEQATGLARRMVTRWGMSERIDSFSWHPRRTLTWAQMVFRERSRSARRLRKPSMPRCSRSSARAMMRPSDCSPHTVNNSMRSPKPCCRGTLGEVEILEVTGFLQHRLCRRRCWTFPAGSRRAQFKA